MAQQFLDLLRRLPETPSGGDLCCHFEMFEGVYDSVMNLHSIYIVTYYNIPG